MNNTPISPSRYDLGNNATCDYFNPQLIRNCCPCANADHPLNNIEGSESYFNADEVIPVDNATSAIMATQYGSECSVGLLAVIYFVLFWILGSAVLLTLFIGVVTTSMEEAQSQQKEEREVMVRVKEIQEAKGISDDSIELYQVWCAEIDVNVFVFSSFHVRRLRLRVVHSA